MRNLEWELYLDSIPVMNIRVIADFVNKRVEQAIRDSVGLNGELGCLLVDYVYEPVDSQVMKDLEEIRVSMKSGKA
ncbi:MAG TPA: hypothetical protein PKI14_01430 [Fervidobacterium sp.]|nr:hypothetical protein [Fervidobacterium sp.]